MQTLSHQGTAISFSEEQKQEKRRSILDLIAAAAAAHPKQGWDVVAKETGFTRKAMEMTGRDTPNFVAALSMVGLTRYEAVEEFRKANHIAVAPPPKKGNKLHAKPVVIPAAAVKPAAQPGNVVPAEPARPAVPAPARPDADRPGDRAAVAAPVEKPAGDPGLRRPVRRAAEPKPVIQPQTQSSLF